MVAIGSAKAGKRILGPDLRSRLWSTQKTESAIKRAIIEKMVLTGNDSLDSFVGLENLLLNLKYVLYNPGVDTLFDRFRGKPGILVASGPSLDQNMHLLKGLTNRAVIASCDASFIPLMNAGIRPHIVGTHERTPGTHLFYKGIENLSDETTLSAFAQINFLL